MNKISCEICMDLIPLVRDGIASEDSCCAVEEHIRTCESCRALYEGNPAPKADLTRGWDGLRRKIRLFWGAVLLLGVFFGMSLTHGADMFYNSLLMPVLGGLSYVVFGRKTPIALPVLITGSALILNGIYAMRGLDHLSLLDLCMLWLPLYILFALLGAAIAWLLHFALKKED